MSLKDQQLNWDHLLMRLKDIVILSSAVVAIVLWLGDFWGLPSKVSANEMNVQDYKQYKAQNEVFVQGLKKDIDYLKQSIDRQQADIKEILRRTRNDG